MQRFVLLGLAWFCFCSATITLIGAADRFVADNFRGAIAEGMLCVYCAAALATWWMIIKK